MPGEPDAEILSRFVQGDQTAFEQLFRRFESEVYRWILRIVRDRSAAYDVLVEALIRLTGAGGGWGEGLNSLPPTAISQSGCGQRSPNKTVSIRAR